jgi:hypothetical protein
MELNQANFDILYNSLLDFKSRIAILEGSPTTKVKSNKYTAEEDEALLKACKGVGLVPKGAITKITKELIEHGWNDTWDQLRTPNALRTHYLRLIGLKD